MKEHYKNLGIPESKINLLYVDDLYTLSKTEHNFIIIFYNDNYLKMITNELKAKQLERKTYNFLVRDYLFEYYGLKFGNRLYGYITKRLKRMIQFSLFLL